MIIIRETDTEHQKIGISRIGKRIFVTTERASVARAIEKQIQEALGAVEEEVIVAGFKG